MTPLARDERRWKLNLCQECRNPFGHKPDCSTLDRWALPYPVDPVEAMPASEHEAALAAAWQVDDAMIERAAQAISDGLEQGYRGHWCAEWEHEQGRGCDRCREIARAALIACVERGPMTRDSGGSDG